MLANPQSQNRQELITESILVTKVSKLTHDGSNVGPGDYDIAQAHKAVKPKPKGSVSFAIDKTSRFARSDSNMGTKILGPGSYNTEHWHERSTKKPMTIPRASKANLFNSNLRKKKMKNRGSIRADFEGSDSESENEGKQLGPGHYLQEFHTSTFGNEPILHDHPQ